MSHGESIFNYQGTIPLGLPLGLEKNKKTNWKNIEYLILNIISIKEKVDEIEFAQLIFDKDSAINSILKTKAQYSTNEWNRVLITNPSPQTEIIMEDAERTEYHKYFKMFKEAKK